MLYNEYINMCSRFPFTFIVRHSQSNYLACVRDRESPICTLSIYLVPPDKRGGPSFNQTQILHWLHESQEAAAPQDVVLMGTLVGRAD